MANASYMKSLIGSLESNIRAAFGNVFDYAFKSLKFGPAESGEASINFGAVFYESTTPSTASQEFTIAHRQGTPPYLAVPVLDLTSSNSQVVPLKVTRPADAQYLYLASSSTNAVVKLLVEGGG